MSRVKQSKNLPNEEKVNEQNANPLHVLRQLQASNNEYIHNSSLEIVKNTPEGQK